MQGANLEPGLGSARFLGLLVELLALSHGIDVLLACALAAFFPSLSYMYYR